MPVPTLDDASNDTTRDDALAERLQSVLGAASDSTEMATALENAHPADIADALEGLSNPDALRVFQSLDNARAAEVLDELDTDKARYVLDNDVEGRISALLDILPMDDAAEILDESATPARQEQLLTGLHKRSPEDARDIRELLSYPPQSAGRLMTDKFLRLSASMSMDEAFTALRHANRDVETLNDLYVMEDKAGSDRLIGVLSLRDLVNARPTARIGDVMVKEAEVISVRVETDQEEVARLIGKYDFLAMPVLDMDGMLAGIVTVDDVVDVLIQEQTEDVLRQSAITTEPGVISTPYFSTPIWRVVRSRVPWLVLLFVAETATGSVLRHFDDELAKVTALAFFIPLLIGTGGNTGAQTVSTIIRGMALKEIRLRDTGRVLGRELLGGLLLGVVLAVIAFVRALMWDRTRGGFQIALVVSLTVAVIIVWANTIGSMIPLAAQKLKIDPALVSAPLITTLVDATGLVFYLLIAKAILDQLR